MHNPVGWFEIPVRDMDRAIAFYKAVFGYDFEKMQMGPILMSLFPYQDEGKGVSGALVLHEEQYNPSDSEGVLLYFTCKDVNDELGRVEKAGGKILLGRTKIDDEHGYMAQILDTEGNRIALHANP
jgi:predicted enzyme related to lactoylglutathione lyase